mgnify:CR=1 FL=1
MADRYDLVRPIGRGSAAVVYVAKDREGGREVALKLIPARAGLRPDEVAHFVSEITGATSERGAVSHLGLPAVQDAGLDAESLYLVSEMLHGETLRDLFARTEPGDEARIDALESCLDPLAAAHAAGLLHGDLSPSHVFLARRRTGEERVMLLDVGLSVLLRERRLAAEGVPLGSPRHASPERLGGGRIGKAHDVWAFGVMLYEAITGALPFVYEHLDALAHHVGRLPHPPPREVRPDVDVSMAQLVDLCLEKAPGRRPPDGRALMRLMKPLRSGIHGATRGDRSDGMLTTVIDQSGAAPAPPPEELEAGLVRSPREPRAHRALLEHYQREEIPDGVWLAATALDHCGAATRAEIKIVHHHRRPPTAVLEQGLDRGLDAAGWAALLHGDQDPRIDAVWSELAEPVLALHRQDDASLGLPEATKMDLGRPVSDLPKAFARAVGAIRPGVLPRLYAGKPGKPPRHLPSHPPASIFPRAFEEPLPHGALVFAVGRHVAYYRPAHRVCTVLHEPEALEAAFDAGVRLGRGWAGERPEQVRLMELLNAQLTDLKRDRLRSVCARLGDSARAPDLGTWRRAVELSCARAGLLLCADLDGAAWMLRWNRERRRIPPEDALDDLIAFWSSGAHVRLRHVLGLASR